jgi:Zn-dependent M28 family amino/carboxypeptidase
MQTGRPIKRLARTVAAIAAVTLAALCWGGCAMFDMPGQSYTGALPPADGDQRQLRQALEADVATLSQTIGPRHVGQPAALKEAARFIEQAFEQTGYAVDRQRYQAAGVACDNLAIEIPGTDAPDEIVLIGAHYDSVPACAGANDNATGVAGMLALARAAANAENKPKRTLRFVAFVNEEPPFFQTPQMGSHVYAKRCREGGDNIVAMISLDGIGYYTNQPNSQTYPLPLLDTIYPDKGNFIAIVGNWSSRQLVYRCVGAFRQHAKFPSQGGAIPNLAPEVGFSDHWSFWQFDYPAVMVTDTLPFRDPNYHTADDRLDHLDFDAIARVVQGLQAVMFDLAKGAS